MNWCNEVSSSYSRPSNLKIKSLSENLITAVEQKKETADKVKKKRSSHTIEFKLEVLKDLNNGQLAACNV